MKMMKKYIVLLLLLKFASVSVLAEEFVRSSYGNDFYLENNHTYFSNDWLSSPYDGDYFNSTASFEELRFSLFQQPEMDLSLGFSNVYLSAYTLQMAIVPSVAASDPTLRPGDFGTYGGIGQIPIGDMSSCLFLSVILYALLVVYNTKARRKMLS